MGGLGHLELRAGSASPLRGGRTDADAGQNTGPVSTVCRMSGVPQ